MTQVVFNIADHVGPAGIVVRYNDLLATAKNPHEKRKHFKTPTTALTMKAPGDLIASHDWPTSDYEYALWKWDGAFVFAETWGDFNMTLRAFVDDEDGADRISHLFGKLEGLIAPLEEPPPGTVSVDFWYWNGDSASSRSRRLSIRTWPDIESNYAADARRSLGDLVALDPATIETGRIILMHGPPGTGKTTALRAIADGWRKWCDTTYVIDPEEMFGRAGYLINVLLGSEDERWRLVIVEDAEEFLTPNAKANVGQSVARLLNLGDGMIGQGLRVLILLTTNAPLVELHKAIMRPGRCLANIEVPRLSASEATQWSCGAVREEATLAELFEATKHSQIGDGIVNRTVGQYV